MMIGYLNVRRSMRFGTVAGHDEIAMQLAVFETIWTPVTLLRDRIYFMLIHAALFLYRSGIGRIISDDK